MSTWSSESESTHPNMDISSSSSSVSQDTSPSASLIPSKIHSHNHSHSIHSLCFPLTFSFCPLPTLLHCLLVSKEWKSLLSKYSQCWSNCTLTWNMNHEMSPMLNLIQHEKENKNKNIFSSLFSLFQRSKFIPYLMPFSNFYFCGILHVDVTLTQISRLSNKNNGKKKDFPKMVDHFFSLLFSLITDKMRNIHSLSMSCDPFFLSLPQCNLLSIITSKAFRSLSTLRSFSFQETHYQFTPSQISDSPLPKPIERTSPLMFDVVDEMFRENQRKEVEKRIQHINLLFRHSDGQQAEDTIYSLLSTPHAITLFASLRSLFLTQNCFGPKYHSQWTETIIPTLTQLVTLFMCFSVPNDEIIEKGIGKMIREFSLGCKMLREISWNIVSTQGNRQKDFLKETLIPAYCHVIHSLSTGGKLSRVDFPVANGIEGEFFAQMMQLLPLERYEQITYLAFHGRTFHFQKEKHNSQCVEFMSKFPCIETLSCRGKVSQSSPISHFCPWWAQLLLLPSFSTHLLSFNMTCTHFSHMKYLCDGLSSLSVLNKLEISLQIKTHLHLGDREDMGCQSVSRGGSGSPKDNDDDDDNDDVLWRPDDERDNKGIDDDESDGKWKENGNSDSIGVLFIRLGHSISLLSSSLCHLSIDNTHTHGIKQRGGDERFLVSFLSPLHKLHKISHFSLDNFSFTWGGEAYAEVVSVSEKWTLLQEINLRDNVYWRREKRDKDKVKGKENEKKEEKETTTLLFPSPSSSSSPFPSFMRNCSKISTLTICGIDMSLIPHLFPSNILSHIISLCSIRINDCHLHDKIALPLFHSLSTLPNVNEMFISDDKLSFTFYWEIFINNPKGFPALLTFYGSIHQEKLEKETTKEKHTFQIHSRDSHCAASMDFQREFIKLRPLSNPKLLCKRWK